MLRRCACTSAPGPTGGCDECRSERLRPRRGEAGSADPGLAPPVVHDVLRSPGRALDAATRTFMEPRFGHSFANVRVHADARGAESARAVAAEAYTVGNDVVFAEGRYRPGSADGDRLIAHELTHVLQAGASHEGAMGMLRIGEPSDAEEREAAAAETRLAAGKVAAVGSGRRAMLRRRPAYIVNHTFLGWPCGGGVNPEMRRRLQLVETHLTTQFDALPESAKTNPLTGQPAASVNEWSGLRQAPGCWRNSTSKHGSGSACDLNYETTPYIATRTEVPHGSGTRTVYGGELAGAALGTERRRVTEVFDRAAAFVGATGDTADVSARRGTGATRETTAVVYARFRSASDALREYLQYAFHAPDPAAYRVNRQPVANPETASAASLLAAIPLTERRPEDEAVADIQAQLDNHEFQVVHSGWPYDARGQYIRMLRDYELVRVPMVYGAPVARPASTRNPAGGFLDLCRELVEALVDIGQLRWGAADLGAHESGDMHHFDLGNHAGYTPGA